MIRRVISILSWAVVSVSIVASVCVVLDVSVMTLRPNVPPLLFFDEWQVIHFWRRNCEACVLTRDSFVHLQKGIVAGGNVRFYEVDCEHAKRFCWMIYGVRTVPVMMLVNNETHHRELFPWGMELRQVHRHFLASRTGLRVLRAPDAWSVVSWHDLESLLRRGRSAFLVVADGFVPVAGRQICERVGVEGVVCVMVCLNDAAVEMQMERPLYGYVAPWRTQVALMNETTALHLLPGLVVAEERLRR